MGDPSATGATATATTGAQPGSATGATLLLSVEDAAALLGISPQAVRKRIAKGTLAAHRAGRAWRVVLTPTTGATDATATAQPPPQPFAQPAQPAALAQAAQLAALVEPFAAPLVARIEALSREAERERARADALQAELDRLRVEKVPTPTAERDATLPVGITEPVPPIKPERRRRAWWRRWLGL